MSTKEQELKEALEQIKALVKNVEGKIEALKLEKEDKFAELKEAYKNGAIIECLQSDGTWFEIEPRWQEECEYRIKPEEKPKVGDVCKFWDYNEEDYVVSKLTGFLDQDLHGYNFECKSSMYKNAKKLTKEEAIELLFGKEENNV